MYNVWLTRQLFPDQNQNLRESGEQTKGPFSLSEIEKENVCYSEYINLNKEALRLFKWGAVVWVELWTLMVFCCRHLIYSSPNCCVTTSKPSCHVHHTQLFIIPDREHKIISILSWRRPPTLHPKLNIMTPLPWKIPLMWTVEKFEDKIISKKYY